LVSLALHWFGVLCCVVFLPCLVWRVPDMLSCLVSCCVPCGKEQQLNSRFIR
jgi:hypothetical protein